MLDDDDSLHPMRAVFALGTPHPDIALETLRRAALAIGRYLLDADADRDDLRKLLNAASTRLTNLGNRLGTLETAAPALTGRVAGVEGSVATLDGRTAALENSTASLTTRLAAVEAALAVVPPVVPPLLGG